jgi:dTDP-4-dehydrorhamnose reductase
MQAASMEHTLIIGADGQIGRALFEGLRQEPTPVTGTSRRKDSPLLFLDLLQYKKSDLPKQLYSTVYICSGMSASTLCEDNPQETRKVNVTSVVELAADLHAEGSRIIYLSTAMVFNGSSIRPTENDIPTPTTEYGRQKFETEQALLQLGGNVVIIRASKVISRRTPLIASWLQALSAGETIEAFTNRYLSPVALSQMIEFMVTLKKRPTSGVVHFSGTDDVSFYDFIRLIAPVERVRATKSESPGPTTSTLSTDKLTREYGISPLTPAEVIQRELTPAIMPLI